MAPKVDDHGCARIARCEPSDRGSLFFAVLAETNSEFILFPKRISHFGQRALAVFRCFTRCFVAENSEKHWDLRPWVSLD
jgi:hypothetical protein